MSVELNHTIVHVRDRWAAARDVGGVLGLPDAQAYGPFAELKLDNGASLDFMDTEGEVHGQHYAFLVGEDDFDLVLGRPTAAPGGPIPTSGSRTRSTTATAAGVSIGKVPTGTGWRSSPAPTAAAAE